MQINPRTSHPRREDRPSSMAGRRDAASLVAREPLPPPPTPVARLLERGIQERRFLFPDNGTVRIMETWQPPSEVEDGLADLAAQHLSELEIALRPAERGVLLARILALLSHFRAEPNPPQVEQMIADDWAEDLGEFPIWAVEEACRQWRRTRKWRPQICEMVALCREAVSEPETRRQRLQALLYRAETRRNPMLRRMEDLTQRTFRRVPA
ncbi:hypothetical protein WDZ11_20670 (plasmid) [Roseomonas mucosa]|mgnify:FL=1|nr:MULTISPECIES: hypothetical protein [unclassified Roseomonas]